MNRSSTTPGIFLVWGETEEQATSTATRLSADGIVLAGDDLLALVWPDGEPLPPSRRTGLEELSERELELVCNAYRRAATKAERDAAIAGGEDVSGLDDLDFYIRCLRRRPTENADTLRMLSSEENPDPKIHWGQCGCASCLEGETHPRIGWDRWKARKRDWEKRYLGLE